jgi:hypothetical protein
MICRITTRNLKLLQEELKEKNIYILDTLCLENEINAFIPMQ